MYNSNNIADRVKKCVKEKGVTVTELIKACNLGANTLGSMREGKMPSVERIAIIADYLDVSVDYLLGRSENKKLNQNTRRDFDNKLLEAYHNKPSMQAAVCQLLQISAETMPKTFPVYRVAESNENHSDEIVRMTDKELHDLRNAPETDEDLM